MTSRLQETLEESPLFGHLADLALVNVNSHVCIIIITTIIIIIIIVIIHKKQKGCNYATVHNRLVLSSLY